MTFVRTSLLNAVAVVIKMLTLLGINKILAVYVGPAGYAALGQFQNLVQMITTFAGGSMNTGVTKYTAEYAGDSDRQHRIWATAGIVSLIGGCIAALLIALFARHLARNFLSAETHYTVFYWLSCGLIFFVLNSLLLAILNGKKEVVAYVTANIIGSLLSFVIVVVLSVYFGLYGALVSLSVYQSIACVATAYICSRKSWFSFRLLVGVIDQQALFKLLKFSLMVGVSAACVPLSSMLVRDYLIGAYGIDFAGYWEALTRLSGAYLMLVTTTLSLYFLPRYSEIKSVAKLRVEVIKALCMIVPVALLGSISVYLLREWLIKLLFSSDFLPIESMVAWQVVGDTLKITSWVLGFLLWARALVIPFIVTEVIFSFGFFFATKFFSAYYGSDGVVIAYAVNYFLYLIALALFFFLWFRKHKILEAGEGHKEC
ncbi:O-antigen translocase [Pseudomonas sp. 35 E 8]|nr:O-antigen translocase [Pseudomonas sp. 35 E 8]